MDICFHAASAALLARVLGERRPSRLWLAAGVGAIPDVVAFICRWCGYPAYALTHSLIFNLPITLLVLFWNWRIAWGGVLHVLMDALTHLYATKHFFYPFAKWMLPIGMTWYRGFGWIIWGLLWTSLLLLAAAFWIKDCADAKVKRNP